MLMYLAGNDLQIFTRAFNYINSLFMHASKTPTCLHVCACSHEPSMWFMYIVIMTRTKISPTNVTVNSEIFACAKFRENEILANREITQSITDMGKSCPIRKI